MHKHTITIAYILYITPSIRGVHFHFKKDQAWVHKFANPKRSKGDQRMNLHFQNRKQITINNLFNEPATVAADASLGLQFADPSLILVIMEMSLQNECVTCGIIRTYVCMRNV